MQGWRCGWGQRFVKSLSKNSRCDAWWPLMAVALRLNETKSVNIYVIRKEWWVARSIWSLAYSDGILMNPLGGFSGRKPTGRCYRLYEALDLVDRRPHSVAMRWETRKESWPKPKWKYSFVKCLMKDETRHQWKMEKGGGERNGRIKVSIIYCVSCAGRSPKVFETYEDIRCVLVVVLLCWNFRRWGELHSSTNTSHPDWRP